MNLISNNTIEVLLLVLGLLLGIIVGASIKCTKNGANTTIKYPIVVESVIVDSITHINVVDANNNIFIIENHSKIYSINDTIQ